MELPGVNALASFLRDRIAELGEAVLGRTDRVEVLPPHGREGREGRDAREAPDHAVVAAARQLATVIIGAAAPFAPTSYSRARLIRQMHASGLLTDEEIRTTHRVLDLDDPAGGAPP